jgi:hypothetical protein
VTKIPSHQKLEEWRGEGRCRATDSCWVEPDGICKHGHESWLVVLALVARPDRGWASTRNLLLDKEEILLVGDPPEPWTRFEVVECIRHGGPRDGTSMGWAVWDNVEVDAEGSAVFKVVETRAEAEAEVKRRSEGDQSGGAR